MPDLIHAVFRWTGQRFEEIRNGWKAMARDAADFPVPAVLVLLLTGCVMILLGMFDA